ncbi:phenylalanine--tRNA ligase subunit beta [Nanoarchaeota archaeon]
MPTINFSTKEASELLGKNISIDDIHKLIPYCKGEVDNYNKAEDKITVDFGDTNLPYLWSTEGVARLLNGVIGKEKGIPKINIKKSDYKIIVDGSVSTVRPYVVSFVAKGKKASNYMIKQMIQLQEKLCESFGRRRQKVAVGIYRLENIKFPIHYKATSPESTEFVPIGYNRAMTQGEILEEHPKGKEYAGILKGAKKYPLLVDSENKVLSFPPIINSAETGEIKEGDSELFFEATGTDLKALNLAANIFAYALADRGFDILSVDVKYGNKTLTTPELKTEKIKLDPNEVEKVLGLGLNWADIKKLLEKARYNVSGNVVEVPSYRGDILHSVDLIEDIAIMYGYDKIKGLPLTEYSVGRTSPITKFIDNIREIVVGQGYQEVVSPILSNKNILFEKMNVKEFGLVEIANPMSETFSCVRNWITPVLMELLSKNRHVDYAQKIFEQGLVTVKKGNVLVDYERIAVVSAHNNSDFTEIKQVLDYLMRLIGADYTIKETKHDSFIAGRVGRVSVKGKDVAYIGEINPIVLRNFDLTVPASGFELNLTELFEVLK